MLGIAAGYDLLMVRTTSYPMYSSIAPAQQTYQAEDHVVLQEDAHPRNMAAMVGTSTTAWPRAIFQPDQRSWKPQAMVTANNRAGHEHPGQGDDGDGTEEKHSGIHAFTSEIPVDGQVDVVVGGHVRSVPLSTSMMETLWMREFMISSMLTGGLL